MNLDGLIKDLRSSKLIAQCPKCDQEFKLADCLLFDGTLKFPTPAEKVRLQLFQAFEERKKQLEKRKISADVTAEKKAIEVGFGKIIKSSFLPTRISNCNSANAGRFTTLLIYLFSADSSRGTLTL